ncbi:carbohydrate kinase [Parashewanella spongiae]|uniref:Carbohydrate kinase n=1 Tax=Parashewanella spongiae TaxID=342950 RepID=A0A3A6U034_9GAMM|nr:FGGY-family carbohydrate kinase [Parashewanella spongiae]MCL1077505.1 FGGY-family carbohydrate kinase [Parashewanella spongiae]RJY18638.1 carbohydrate kinase [Parashewanella spongiae]
MDKPYLLALDYGTQSVRAILFDTQGALIHKAQISVDPFIKSQKESQSGSAEQHPEYCYAQLVQVVKQLITVNQIDTSLIGSLSITTQRACIILTDDKFKPISPIFMWSDTRLADSNRLSPMSWYFRAAFKIVGMDKRIGFLRRSAKVNFIEQTQPNLIKNADKVALFSGYLIHKMTGVAVDSVASQVAYLPFDYKNLTWAKGNSWRWQALACSQEQMMNLIPAAKIIGKIDKKFCEDTGLNAEIVVATAGGDKACEMFATGSGEVGIANISLGSAACISIGLKRYQESYRYMPPFPSIAENQFMNEIQLERGFWLLSWLIDEFGQEDKLTAAEQRKTVEAYICEKIIDIAPGSDGLLLCPTWSQGVIYPGPEARGSIVGFTPKHTRFHLYRAAIEGVLFTLKSALLRLEKKHNYPVKIVRISGGGSQSEQVLKMAANILNKPVEVIDIAEASALGAAMCAATASGIYDDVYDARKSMMNIDKRINPEREESLKYQQIFKSQSTIYRRVKPILKALVEK